MTLCIWVRDSDVCERCPQCKEVLKKNYVKCVWLNDCYNKKPTVAQTKKNNNARVKVDVGKITCVGIDRRSYDSKYIVTMITSKFQHVIVVGSFESLDDALAEFRELDATMRNQS